MRWILLVFLVISLFAFARPNTVTCPQDGQPMYFDHVVGMGDNAVCWYSHNAYDNGRSVKHEGYISCPNGV